MSVTKTARFQVLFFLGLVSGTVNSLMMKICYQVGAVGNDSAEHFFHKPWFMSFVMFLAMLIALPIYYMQRRQKHICWKTWLIVSVPSVCDMLGSSMQQIGLIFTPVSIYQMLKGSILLFSAALSVLFLNKKMHRSNWVGVGLCVVALTLVGVSSVMAIEAQPVVVSSWEALFGIAVVILGQIVCASQYVLEEFLLKPPNDVSPMAMVGMEGLWGTVLMAGVILPTFQFLLRGSDVGNVYENTYDTLAMIKESVPLQVLLSVSLVSTFVYNICGVMVTQQASAVHHTFLDATRTIFVWIASVAVYYHPGADRSFGEPLTRWSILELLGFALLLLGECLYDGLVPLPQAWTTKLERIDPLENPVRIPTMTPSPHGILFPDQFANVDKEPLLEIHIE